MTERERGIDLLRQRTVHAAVQKQALAMVRNPCLYDEHLFESSVGKMQRCENCAVFQIRGLSNAPRKALQHVRNLMEDYEDCKVVVRITRDLQWRRLRPNYWDLLVRLPRQDSFWWYPAGSTGPTTYDDLMEATRIALAKSPDAVVLFKAIRKAVYGPGAEWPSYVEAFCDNEAENW